MTWHPEEIEALKRYAAEGVLSCSEIADQLGTGRTRSAVLGKLHRLGIRKVEPGGRIVVRKATYPPPRIDYWTEAEDALLRDTSLSSTQISERTGRSTSAIQVRRSKLGITTGRFVGRPRQKTRTACQYGGVSNAAARIAAPIEAPPEPRGDRPGLMQLGYRMCKYPYGDPRHCDFHYCGAPTEVDHSYCAGHERICYATAPSLFKVRRISPP